MVSVEIYTVLPHAAVAFDAVCLRQGTGTGVRAQTLPSMAHPGLAEVTYRSLVAKNTPLTAEMYVLGSYSFLKTLEIQEKQSYLSVTKLKHLQRLSE